MTGISDEPRECYSAVMGSTLITERDGAVAVLTLHRPDKLNALNAELLGELGYTGDTINAEEALRIGLVNAVAPHAELLPKVKEVAAKIASKGRIAVAQCKRVMYSGADIPIDVANALELQAFAMLFGTAD